MRFSGELTWITVIWISFVSSNTQENTADPIDFTVVHDSTIYDVSQSADGLPDRVKIEFEILGRPVVLNLGRNQKMKSANSISVIRMSESGVPVIVPQMLDENEVFGEYHDLQKKAIFTWSCGKPKDAKSSNICRPYLEGTFMSGDVNYRMQVMDDLALSRVGQGSANKMTLWNRVKDIVGNAHEPIQVYGIYLADSTPTTPGDFKESDPLIRGRTAAFGREARIVRENVLPGGEMYNMEVLAIIDYGIYQRFYKASKLGSEREKDGEAKYRIKKYFSHVFNGVDMLYQNIDDRDFGLSVAVSGFIIADSPDVSPWTTPHVDQRRTGRDELLVSTPLNELIRWSFRARNIPENDHIMLLTDYDLYSMDNGVVDKRTAGYARVGSVCSLDSVSVIEDHGGFQSINAAAHELGHSLGARHDGTRNECNPRSQYIMTAHGGFESESTKQNPWKFSKCSVDYFKKYINTLSGRHCLTDPVDIFDEAAFKSFVANYPGQEMTPNEQCQDILGLDSFYGWGTELGSFSEICNEMSCAVPGSSRSYRVYKAATGTSCGDKQWCIKGQCVFDQKAPSKNPSCVFGDTQRRFAGGKSCRQYMLENPMRCYDKFYKDRCCDTCDKLNTGVQGCEYGDKFLNCKSQNCGNRFYARDCCSTCNLAPHPVINPVTEAPRPVTRAPPVTQRPARRTTKRPTTTRRTTTTTTTRQRPAKPGPPSSGGTPLEPSGDSGLCLRRDNRFLLVFRCSSLPNLFGQAACDNPLISRFCCEPCPAPGEPLCEDKPSCGIRYARQCYIPQNRDDCCRTCKRFNTGRKGCEYGDRIRSCERYAAELGPTMVCSRYTKYCCGLCEGISTHTDPNALKSDLENSAAAVVRETPNTINIISRDQTNGSIVIVGTSKRNMSGRKRQHVDVQVGDLDRSSLRPPTQTEQSLNSRPVGGILVRSLPMPTIFISRRGPPGRWRMLRRFRTRPGHRLDTQRQLQLAIAGK